MDNYTVKLYPRAYRDIEDVYRYIAEKLSEPTVAENMINDFEKAIYSLEQMPERCPERQIGIYANRGYRQMFVKNYVIIYRVIKEGKEVHIITVRYAPGNF